MQEGERPIEESVKGEGETSGVGTGLHKELDSRVKHIRSLDGRENGESPCKRSRLVQGAKGYNSM